jgi:hypothetical protein
MHLCTCVSEEGGDGESEGSETLSLLSYTLGYVSLADLDRLQTMSGWVTITDTPKMRDHSSFYIWNPFSILELSRRPLGNLTPDSTMH